MSTVELDEFVTPDIPALPEIASFEPEWTEFVLSRLENDELHEGYPTVDGLRRVTEAVYGEIVDSQTNMLEIPDGNYTKCTAKHTLTVHKYATQRNVTVNAVIDVRKENTQSPFDKFLVATADSRAEGKAFRRLLKLKIVTAEELTEEEDDIDLNLLIKEEQILVIDNLCKRNNLNVMKVVNKYGKYKNIDEVPRGFVRKILKDITKYQNDKEIFTAKTYQNYVEGWKNK